MTFYIQVSGCDIYSSNRKSLAQEQSNMTHKISNQMNDESVSLSFQPD